MNVPTKVQRSHSHVKYAGNTLSGQIIFVNIGKSIKTTYIKHLNSDYKSQLTHKKEIPKNSHHNNSHTVLINQ